MKTANLILLHRYAGLGDALFLNTIAYYLARQINKKVLVGTNYPDLMRGNISVIIFPVHNRKWGFRLSKLLLCTNAMQDAIYLSYDDELRENKKSHILSILSKKVGLNVVPEYPILFLNNPEIEKNKLPPGDKKWVAIQAQGNTSWTGNKEWFPERMAKVAENLSGSFRTVQIGLSTDKALPVDLDLRGKVTPRAAAAILKSCKLFVGQVGYLMHAAAAVETPSVIVYGGFESPIQSGYKWNHNLFTDLECSPCWLPSTCPYDRKCMQEITSDQVVAAIKEMIDNPRKLNSHL
jgi:hypothetical protein